MRLHRSEKVQSVILGALAMQRRSQAQSGVERRKGHSLLSVGYTSQSLRRLQREAVRASLYRRLG